MEDSTSRPTFNIALGYTNFLLLSLHNCSEHSRQKDYDNWFFELLVLYRWLSTRMKGDMMNAIEGQPNDNKEDSFSLMEKYISEIEPLISTKQKGNGIKTLYFKLHRMEMFLRKMLKDAGLEMKEQEDLLEPEMEW